MRRGWSEQRGRQRRQDQTWDLKALKVGRHVLQLTRRVLLDSLRLTRRLLLDSLQLSQMGLRLGHLLGLQLCQLGLQYYTHAV